MRNSPYLVTITQGYASMTFGPFDGRVKASRFAVTETASRMHDGVPSPLVQGRVHALVDPSAGVRYRVWRRRTRELVTTVR